MKVTFSGVGITEMTGKAQRIIIQKSYGGFQCRLLTIPNRRRTNATQNIRNNFAFVNSSWRSLTNEQRQTWIDAAPEGVSGFQFYSSYNLGLVNAGQGKIESFVAPVANPGLAWTYDYIGIITPVGNMTQFELSGSNSYQAIPFYTWTPAFTWTGWVAPSVNFFPRINKSMNSSSFSFAMSFWYLLFNQNAGGLPAPPGVGWKMRMQEAYRNEATGQLYVKEVREWVAESFSITTNPYIPGINTFASTYSPGTPDNVLEVLLGDAVPGFDFATWEPHFFWNGWGANGSNYERPVLTPVPDTAIEFIDTGNIKIHWGSTTGYLEPPPGAGDSTLVTLGWRNTITGERSTSDSYPIDAVTA